MEKFRPKDFIIKVLLFFISLFLVLLIGHADYLADPYLSFYIFYLIPIFLTTWFINEWAGLVISLGSFIVWFYDDARLFSSFSHSLVIFKIWNQVLKFILCCVFVFFTGMIKNLLIKLRRSDELKSQFVANVTHELKSPLFIVKESLALVLDGLKGEVKAEQKEILEIGRANIDRLLRLAADLLDISKIEAGKMELKLEEIDIAALLNKIVKSFEASFEKKLITFKLGVVRDIGSLMGDRDKLYSVISNLLHNALKYTPERGNVVLTVKGDEKDVRFEISDTGPGIPKDSHEKIFDKFERITAEKQEGTGLGLPIAKDIVELHRGKIWVEGEAGQGSKFIFVIPRKFKK